jgi:hypothetical protein
MKWARLRKYHDELRERAIPMAVDRSYNPLAGSTALRVSAPPVIHTCRTRPHVVPTPLLSGEMFDVCRRADTSPLAAARYRYRLSGRRPELDTVAQVAEAAVETVLQARRTTGARTPEAQDGA